MLAGRRAPRCWKEKDPARRADDDGARIASLQEIAGCGLDVQRRGGRAPTLGHVQPITAGRSRPEAVNGSAPSLDSTPCSNDYGRAGADRGDSQQKAVKRSTRSRGRPPRPLDYGAVTWTQRSPPPLITMERNGPRPEP